MDVAKNEFNCKHVLSFEKLRAETLHIENPYVLS